MLLADLVPGECVLTWLLLSVYMGREGGRDREINLPLIRGLALLDFFFFLLDF